MTPNKSLELSVRLKAIMQGDILQFIEPIFPIDAMRRYEQSTTRKSRDRVYNSENTLLTMVVTALHEDRSLQNSVRIFQEIFHRSRESVLKAAMSIKQSLKSKDTSPKRKRGRPRCGGVRVPISKIKDISNNTAAFSKARNRVDQALIDQVFNATTIFDGMNCIQKWHDRLVYNTDGTYFQMQDAPGIPEKYRVQKNVDGTTQGYPQGLLQVLTQHGSGFISSYRIAGRDQSELDIFCQMTEDIPSGSLVLGDDLYNCYALFCHMADCRIDMIVPDKKSRRYKVIKEIAPGDELIELSKPGVIRPLFSGQNIPDKIVLRRITYCDSEHPEEKRSLLTTILDETIERVEFIHRFVTRWDIEISIREIKTIMGINIARSKTEEMVFREIGVALLAYNLVRRIVEKSTREEPFSPETDLFEKLYSTHKNTLVDRKGRVYSRWSPGRPVSHHNKNNRASDTTPAEETLSEKNKSRSI